MRSTSIFGVVFPRMRPMRAPITYEVNGALLQPILVRPHAHQARLPYNHTREIA